jgi:hypothetical protein
VAFRQQVVRVHIRMVDREIPAVNKPPCESRRERESA